MRLSNRKKLPFYNFIGTFANVLLAAGVIMFIFDYIVDGKLLLKSWLFLIVPLLILYVFYRLGRPVFEYDSNGEALVIKNYGGLLKKKVSDEFPKYKLKSFEIISFLGVRRIFIRLHSKRKGEVILKYDISFLSKNERSDLRLSLHRILKNNKELERIA